MKTRALGHEGTDAGRKIVHDDNLIAAVNGGQDHMAADIPRSAADQNRHDRSLLLVWRIRNSQVLGPRARRISDSKPHWQFIESSVVFGFEVPKRECQENLRNFKSTTLGGRRVSSESA